MKDWIQSYRDLPLLMNIWNNVVRWEMRTRLFLRTTEFLWQEAHTFHASAEEAAEEVRTGLDCYVKVAEDWLAIPVIQGRKTEAEKFPGADYTWCIEAMMRDKKALQAGTSHILGQNFARAAGIEFLDRDNVRKHPYGTSWGFSTRMVGATIMTHGDDSGLVMPPNVGTGPGGRRPDLPQGRGEGRGRRGDRQVHRGPRRHARGQGRPRQGGLARRVARLQVQPLGAARRPVPAGDRAARRRRRPGHARQACRPLQGAGAARCSSLRKCPRACAAYQAELFQRALDFRAANTHNADTFDQLRDGLDGEGGFFMAPWCGDSKCEKQINEEIGATIRCIPFDSPGREGQVPQVRR